jgi:hypothetical protein
MIEPLHHGDRHDHYLYRRLTRRCYCGAGSSEALGAIVFTEVSGELARRRSRAPVR